jgi:hypothetical protein
MLDVVTINSETCKAFLLFFIDEVILQACFFVHNESLVYSSDSEVCLD